MKKNIILVMVLMLLIPVFFGSNLVWADDRQDVATFSIVAGDSVTGELGIAVASRFFTVGNVVPWAKAGVGAVATQAYANTSFGWRGLELMEKGLTPEEIMTALLRDDNDPERRQFGMVAADGK